MPLIDLIDGTRAPLLVRDLFAGGDPGPLVGALAQVPELCRVTLPFVGAALGGSAVPTRWKEMAIVRTSALLGCRYCVDAHTVVALDTGLTPGEVRYLRGECERGELFADPVESTVLAWIDAVAGGRGPVPDTVRADASVHLPDHVLVELTVTIGATMLLNRFATALELPTRPATTERLADEGLDGWEAR